MASRFAQDFSAGAVDDLLYELGESLTRWPLGVEADAETVTGIVYERDASQDKTRGENNVRTMRIQISDADDCDPSDVWVIRTEQWSVSSVAGPNAGLRLINLRKSERQRVKPVGVN